MARGKESAGLGADYEKLVLSSTEKRERTALAFRASRFVYRLLSWVLSLALTFVAFIATFGVADAFLSANLALLLAVVALALLIWGFRRSWRRYRAPLVRLVPASDYQQFVTREEPAAKNPSRLKLDLRILKRVETGSEGEYPRPGSNR
jgi:hypothetical protein